MEEKQKVKENEISVKKEDLQEFEKTMDFLNMRATGEEPTVAKMIRDFVRGHETYKFDSIASEECLNDLMRYLYNVQVE